MRNAENIRPPRARINLYKNSFYPSTIDLWNTTSKELRDSPCIVSFKRSLANSVFVSSVPAYYSDGERLPAIWHTRLRLGHSTLSQHAFSHGISDSDLCSCGCKEDSLHYFLKCPKYAAPRIKLLTAIAGLISPGVHFSLLLHINSDYILSLILKGSSDLSLADNMTIFQLVQQYIKCTKRFDDIFQF